MSNPIDGAMWFETVDVENDMTPAFAPQNHESWKGRFDWAAPTAGNSAARASPEVIHRTVRMVKLLMCGK